MKGGARNLCGSTFAFEKLYYTNCFVLRKSLLKVSFNLRDIGKGVSRLSGGGGLRVKEVCYCIFRFTKVYDP